MNGSIGRAAHGERGVPADGRHKRRAAHVDKGLKKDAIGFVGRPLIGLASTAPAYSLAAVIGSIVVAAGVQAPGVLLVSFIPMFFIAAAFYYMNRVDTDCGTTFSWVTRALGPYAGWIGGWAICTTGILVSARSPTSRRSYLYDLLGLTYDGGKPCTSPRSRSSSLAVAIIVVMTTICVLGTELSAKLQRVLTLGQVGACSCSSVVDFVAPDHRQRAGNSIDPELAGSRRSGSSTRRCSPASCSPCSSTGAGRAP